MVEPVAVGRHQLGQHTGHRGDGRAAARFLSAIAEHELAERAHRRIERHLAEAHLPPGKTLDSFAFEPDSCQTGMPENLGFTLIDTVPDDISTYNDNNGGQGLAIQPERRMFA